VYAQDLVGTKLLIAILVLALSGTNSDLASMCAAYCMSSASVHHDMESQPLSVANRGADSNRFPSAITISHHIHAHHKSAECAECPPRPANSLNQNADCTSLVQMEALKEASFPFDAPCGVAHVDSSDTAADALALAGDGEPSLLFGTARRIRSSCTASVPLRI
jgi:hypothetical protein